MLADRPSVPMIVAAVLGIGLGGLFAASMLYEYSPFATSYLAAIPVFGVLLYFWTRAVERTITLAAVSVVVGGVVGGGTYLTPLVVQDGVTDLQWNFVVLQSFSRIVVFVAIGSVLLGAGLVVGSVLRNEVLGRGIDGPTSDSRRRILGLSTVVVAGSAATLGSQTVLNYASTIEHESRQVTVEDAVRSGDELSVTLSIPNELRDELRVESVLVIAVAEEHRSASTLVDRTVPSGASGELTASFDVLPPDGAADPLEVRIDGVVYVSAFSSYEHRMRIREYRETIAK